MAEPMGFYTDTTVCIGCKACEVACKEWNQLPATNGGLNTLSGDSYDNTRQLDGIHWRHVKFIEQFTEDRRDGRWLLMSDVCKHCVQAACLEVCPTNAIVRTEFDIPAKAENIVAGPGAKVFEQFFCEAFLDPGDGVLVFSPYFPTYIPNIQRRGARAVMAPLRQANEFRPDVADIEKFLSTDAKPRAIFLNSPHNPTGGVTTAEDLHGSRCERAEDPLDDLQPGLAEELVPFAHPSGFSPRRIRSST